MYVGSAWWLGGERTKMQCISDLTKLGTCESTLFVLLRPPSTPNVRLVQEENTLAPPREEPDRAHENLNALEELGSV